MLAHVWGLPLFYLCYLRYGRHGTPLYVKFQYVPVGLRVCLAERREKLSRE
jgi:hypothetical protein